MSGWLGGLCSEVQVEQVEHVEGVWVLYRGDVLRLVPCMVGLGLPVNRQTHWQIDTTENITFTTLLADGNKACQSELFILTMEILQEWNETIFLTIYDQILR